MRGRDWTAFDDLRQGLMLDIIQQRHPAGRRCVDQPSGTGAVAPQPPIANRLQTNPAKVGRSAAGAALINRRATVASASSRRTWFASRLDRASARILAAVKSSRSATADAIANLHPVRNP